MRCSWNNARPKHNQQDLYFNIKILQPKEFLLTDWLEAFVSGVNLEIPNLRKYCM